jgi:hypothetical protein
MVLFIAKHSPSDIILEQLNPIHSNTDDLSATYSNITRVINLSVICTDIRVDMYSSETSKLNLGQPKVLASYNFVVIIYAICFNSSKYIGNFHVF